MKYTKYVITKVEYDSEETWKETEKDIIISSMTKAQKAQEEVKELTKLVKGYKGSNTRMKNKIKAFEKRLEI